MPNLREMITEASLSLARLDADRLEELALSCQALNRDHALVTGKYGAQSAWNAGEAAREMALFGRVLAATRANLDVVKQLQRMRERTREYQAGTAVVTDRDGRWTTAGGGDGDN